MEHSAIEHTKAWVEQIVIGLNLCPFAGNPFRNQLIRYRYSDADTHELLLKHLIEEILLLTEKSYAELETTLLIHPGVLQSFEDYNAFASNLELIIDELGFTGVYQIAEFHPQYQFAETRPEDVQNYTNRSPYPMLHLLREERVESALKSYPDTQNIPEINIKTMESLGVRKIREILRRIKGA
ncbi:MAG: DUF1415 domain-containing protein [Bacteroidota bacterium]